MSSTVHWLLELDVKDGQLDSFKTLMNEMVTATRADEPGGTRTASAQSLPSAWYKLRQMIKLPSVGITRPRTISWPRSRASRSWTDEARPCCTTPRPR